MGRKHGAMQGNGMQHRGVCPFWIGLLLASPLRRLVHDPVKILGPHVRTGMTVLDVGSAMGFFSLPLARLVAPDGRVLCVEMQERMLRVLERRARKSGVQDLIEARPCTQDSLGLHGLDGTVDFALVFAMVHEVPDPERLFAEILRAMKPGASLLMAEPKGHVRIEAFEASVSAAAKHGCSVAGTPRVRGCHAVLLQKTDSPQLGA
jgi:ubiquinone/menaquinone biosynthesis C-methylase UbiE